MKIFILYLQFLLGAAAVFAQSPSLVISDETTQKPVEGARVVVKSLVNGATKTFFADKKGFIPISSVQLPASVIVQHIAYFSVFDTLKSATKRAISLKPRAFQREEVVVTGQYAPERADRSLYKVRVVDNEKISLQGAVSARDILANETNIRISQDNMLGASMSVQGIKGQNVKILVDGVPVIGRQDGNIDLMQVPLASVERLEIVEGPLSAMYGTDALAGAVNLITKTPKSKEISLGGALYYESVGQYNADCNASYSFNTLALSANIGRHFFGGYDNPDTSRRKQWRPREQYLGDWSALLPIDSWKLRYTGSYFDELFTNLGAPREPYRETAFDEYFKTIRFNNALFLDGSFDDYYLSASAAYNRFYRRRNFFFRDLVHLTNTQTGEDQQDTTTFHSWFLRGTFAKNPSSGFGFQLGYDIAMDEGAGKKIKDLEQTMGDFALFASLQFSPFGGFEIQPALRAAHNTRYAAPLVPSLNLKWTALHDFTLRASVARGFRAPSLKELFLFFVDINHNVQGNTELKAEHSNNLQLFADYNLSTSENSLLKLEASGFYNEIKDMISLIQSAGTLYSYYNVERYKTVGGRVGMSYFRANITGNIGVTYTGRNSQLKNASAERFLFSPEIQSNFTYSLPEIGVRLAVFYKFTGELPQLQEQSDGTIVEGFIEKYHTLDVTASGEFLNKALTLSAGVKNLFNVQNLRTLNANTGDGNQAGEGVSTPFAWGRTFFVNCAVAWK